MTLTVLETTGQPVISLAEAKAFLRITHDLEDAIIENCIQSAVEWVETYTGKILQKKKVVFSIPINKRVRQQAGLSLRLWHSSGRSLFFLPVMPLIEVVDVSLILMTGELQNISLNKVHVNAAKDPPFVMIDEFGGWGFRFHCWVGYEEGSKIPPLLKQAVFQCMTSLYENRGVENSLLIKHCGHLLDAIKKVEV